MAGSLGRLKNGLSQTWFDNAAGRWVVVLGPNESEQTARHALADQGLAASEFEIRHSDLGHKELESLIAQTSKRLQSVAPGHVAVGTSAAQGVEIQVAADATAAERALVADIAETPDVHATQSDRASLSVQPRACESHISAHTGIPDRFCTNLRGGSRYTFWKNGQGPYSCTLGWWAGFPGDPSYSPYFLTAGHCLPPDGG